MSQRLKVSTDLSAMTVSEAASFWWVKHDAQSLSPEEQRAFEAWLAADPVHAQAYEHMQSMWDNFEQDADPAELRVLRTAALSVAPAPRVWPRIAAVALICCVAASTAFLYNSQIADSDPTATRAAQMAGEHSAAEHYSTARNERSTVTLSDGTVVTLNLGTTLDVAFTPAERFVRITQGQAFFEVAKNPLRPFVVAAADRRVTALGTQFDVRLDPDRVEVVLLEGKVSVDHDSPTVLERLNFRKAHVELKPGEKLVAALGEPVTVTDTNAQRVTSWRQGWVVFDNETVGNAVAELNRYADHPLTVPDESVRNLRLSGVFKVGQPDRFAAIIQELLPVKAVQGAEGTTLLIRTEPGAPSTP
jgi:transmembrane sensor